MRVLIVLVTLAGMLAIVLVALGYYAQRRRRERDRQWVALPARWVVEVVDRAGFNVDAVETVAMLNLTMPDTGDIVDRHQVTSTLLTSDDAGYVDRVAEMHQQAQREADLRNRRRSMVEQSSQAAGRLTIPHSWTI